jgi:hypothetical protein
VLGTSTRSRSRPKFFSGSRPKKKYPIANQTRSRPELDDRIEIFWVATRSKILDCFHQTVYPGKFSEKFSGSRPITGLDRNFFLGRDQFLNFWVATYGSNIPNTTKISKKIKILEDFSEFLDNQGKIQSNFINVKIS